MLNIAIKIYFTLPYYASIMLNAFNDLLCSKVTIGTRLLCAGIIGGSLPIMLALYYAQNYASIIGSSLSWSPLTPI